MHPTVNSHPSERSDAMLSRRLTYGRDTTDLWVTAAENGRSALHFGFGDDRGRGQAMLFLGFLKAALKRDPSLAGTEASEAVFSDQEAVVSFAHAQGAQLALAAIEAKVTELTRKEDVLDGSLTEEGKNKVRAILGEFADGQQMLMTKSANFLTDRKGVQRLSIHAVSPQGAGSNDALAQAMMDKIRARDPSAAVATEQGPEHACYLRFDSLKTLVESINLLSESGIRIEADATALSVSTRARQ